MIDLALILFTSMIAAHFTYFLTHRFRVPVIRAASGLALLFVGLGSLFPTVLSPQLQAVFYMGCFVGMSEPSRLKEAKVILAAAVAGGLFFFLRSFGIMQIKGGIGGTLGGIAFLSCLLVYWAQIILQNRTRN